MAGKWWNKQHLECVTSPKLSKLQQSNLSFILEKRKKLQEVKSGEQVGWKATVALMLSIKQSTETEWAAARLVPQLQSVQRDTLLLEMLENVSRWAAMLLLSRKRQPTSKVFVQSGSTCNCHRRHPESPELMLRVRPQKLFHCGNLFLLLMEAADPPLVTRDDPQHEVWIMDLLIGDGCCFHMLTVTSFMRLQQSQNFSITS